MQSTKSVRFENVENIMEQMFQAPIFCSSVKREMLSTENNSWDPNIIMDLRHKTIGEPLPVSVTKKALIAEVTRLIMDEETQALYRKREKELLESELKKFEKGLSSSRPRFHGPYVCGKRKFFDNIEDYDELWKMAPRRVKVKVKDISKNDQSEPRVFDNSYSVGTIKVTIKGKPIIATWKENDREMLKKSFGILKNYAKETRRLRELKLAIQENLASRRMRKYFEIWKKRMENSKRLAARKKEDDEISDERKIELFVNAINEKQRKIAKKKPMTRELTTKIEDYRGVKDYGKLSDSESRKKSGAKIVHVVESPSQNRLNAQKKIIAEQKIKLAEQNRIIEELRLERMEKNARKADQETINVAKEALAHCGQRRRRTLIQLMREEGFRDKALLEPPRLPSPPRFLARMELRAAARRERVRKSEEEKKRKLEEQRVREEVARREEEENQKRLRVEAQREARRIREEQEKKRAREIERSRLANEMADKFYRKYLMRRYIMNPLVALVELQHNYARIASTHCDNRLLRKTFETWQAETMKQRNAKLELSTTVWQRNILWHCLKNWREATKSGRKKAQVAIDFYEFRLQERCLKIWCARAIEWKLIETKNIEMANSHAEMRLKIGYFEKWKKYLKISEDVKESERRRDLWRELVQHVVPDFDPKQRGVIIDD